MAAKASTAVRQEQIVAAILRIVDSRGLSNFTTAALAQEVGLTEGALFKHFASKEEMLRAAVEKVGYTLVKKAAEISRSALPPEEKIRALLNFHLGLVETNPGISRIIFSDELYTSYPGLKETIKEIISEYILHIRAIFKQGMAQGVFQSHFSPECLVDIFGGLIQGAIIRWRLYDRKLSLPEQAGHIYRAIMLLAGYRGDNP